MIATKEPLGRRYRAHFSWGSHERSALLLDAGAVMLFLGLALAILARGVLFGDILDDPDILLQSIPAYTWYADSLREGQIPIWSSAILGGFPLAFGQYGFFYPPDMVLFRLLDVSRAFHLSLGLHLALAGISTYIYCRVLGLGRLPSLFAGLAFQMGNEVLEWPANGFITRTLFVLPALLAIAELLVRGRTRFWLALPVVIAAALLGGYAQILLFAIGFTALYVLFIAIASRGPARTAAAMAGVLLLAGVALGFGLAAVRVAPTLALTAMSTRASGIGLMRSSVDSIAPGDLLAGYMLPAITELGGNLAARPDYPGAAALFLAILALALGRRGRVPAFHGAAAVAAIALSLGSNTPLYGLLLNLPFFGYFRGPNRLSLVAALSISVLAAYALDSRLAGLLAHRRRTYFGIAVIAAALSVAVAAGTASSVLFQFGHDPFSERLRSVLVERGWDALNLLRPRVGLPVLLLAATPLLLLARARGRVSELKFVWILLIMSTCTLFTLGWLQNRWISPSELSQAPDFARIVKGTADGQRMLAWAPQVMAYNLAQHYQTLRGRQPSDSFKAEYERQFVPPNLGMLFGVSTADGYEVLQSRRQALVSTYLGSSRREKATFADGTLVDDRAMTRQLPERLRFMEAVGVGYLANAFRLDDP
ncbi:MAG TPA: hypothetical protein VF960_13245 [Chloroflexota bacterium]